LTVALALLFLQNGEGPWAPATLTGKLRSLHMWSKKVETMLPPFIIEQIRRREERERARHEQPRLELPVDRPAPRVPQPPDDAERGVVIIEL